MRTSFLGPTLGSNPGFGERFMGGYGGLSSYASMIPMES
jgi:hypothetical protein